ncbi:flagellar basal body P-ring formation chaperone FlgA [Rheinheimera texasensis]|uniref:flagellar basal body P-ring formation chaperone FlgA n=1 Tax=Rheinheimera texasensis TaxID=306205 RepID=UPI0032B2EB61
MKMYDNFNFKALRYLLLLLPALSAEASAETYSAADLTNAAQQWLQQQTTPGQTQIRVHPLDDRTKARECDVALQFSLVNPKIQSQNSIKVLCAGTRGWQLYLSARASQLVDVVVATRQLAPGSVLSVEMVQLESRDQLFSRGATVSNPDLVEGARTKRALSPGQILTLRDLCLVCKGDMVTIEGISGTLMVATSGKALADGSLGDNIEVQNLNSGRKVQANVTAVKKVAINL